MATKSEDGVDFPASDYCYVPDPESPSTWKLRVTSTPGGKPDPAIVGAAAAALGPGGFRGNPVELPAGDRAAVVACVRRAWKEAHPDKEMADMPMGIQSREEDDADETINFEIDDAELEVRSIERREIGARIVPWDTPIDTPIGIESFKPGSFAHLNPKDVVLKVGHEGPVVGRGFELEERADGPHIGFRVSKTQAGDEALTLAADKVLRYVSVEYSPAQSKGTVGYRDQHRTVSIDRAAVKAVALTYKPAYMQAELTYVREDEGVTPMAEQEPGPIVDTTPFTDALAAVEARMAERLDKYEEQRRSAFTIPAGAAPEPSPRAKRGDWMSTVIRMLSGERVNDLQLRDLADLVTTDNVGVVPDAFSQEIIGVIDPTRPFMSSTRRLDLPAAGMSLIVPKIVTRPTAGVQSIYGDESLPEKSDIASTPTSITNATFDAKTIAGGGDISLQLLKRSSPSYLSLFLELLAEAYGQNCEQQALGSLLDTAGGGAGTVNDGGTLSPSDLVLGPAWSSAAAVKQRLNTIWLSSAAVGAFIDAKATTTNAPLYSNIQAGFTAGGGAQGTISGLRPVYVPQLDTTDYDVLVGPSSGFGWTEDGTYTLQVDVPAKAGRDVALVGIVWFAPMYPDAFTAYVIGS